MMLPYFVLAVTFCSLFCASYSQTQISEVVREKARAIQLHQSEMHFCSLSPGHAGYLLNMPAMLYMHIQRSRVEKDSSLEGYCVSAINSEEWADSSICGLLSEGLSSNASAINQQALSGRTILMMLAGATLRSYVPPRDLKKCVPEALSIQDVQEIHIAEVCRLLLEKGASVDIIDNDGENVLHRAVEALRTVALNLFFARIATLEVRNKHGETALLKLLPLKKRNRIELIETANVIQDSPQAIEKRVAIFKLFLNKKANLNAIDDDGNALLHRAASLNMCAIIKLLLQSNVDKNLANFLGRSPLHFSCIENDSDAIELFIANKVRSTIKDIFGNQPFHYACASGVALDIFDGTGLDTTEDVNNSGWHPLHIACLFDNLKAVKVLVKKGANVNARIISSRKTALMIACENGHFDICLVLCNSPHIDKNAYDVLGMSAITWALEFDHAKIYRFLLSSGFPEPSVNEKTKLLEQACQEDNASALEMYFELWPLWNNQDQEGNTVLHIACMKGYTQVVIVMLKNFVSHILGLKTKNRAGQTPYACAELNGNVSILKLLRENQVFE